MSLVIGLIRTRLHRGPTQRASGVGVEPHVNTLNMKTMLTLGQYPTRFVLFKFRQTNGAIERLGVGLGGVDENRERFQDSGVEAAGGGDDGIGVSGVNIEDKMRTTVVAVTADLAATRVE